MVDTVGKGGAGGKITSPFLGGSRRKIKKRLKELQEKKEARRVQTEKDLKYSDPRPSPTITKTEAIARSTAKKEALVQNRKALEKIINPI